MSTPNLRHVLQRNRAAILEIAKKHGAYNVRIFGSVARNEFHPERDIDFLVTMEEGRSLLDLTHLWLDLEGLLQCKVDVLTDGGISPYLEPEILKEAVPL